MKTNHAGYLKLLAWITRALPKLQARHVKRAKAHIEDWRNCDKCVAEASSEALLAPEETAFLDRHRDVFSTKGVETIRTMGDKPAGDLALSIEFKQSHKDFCEMDAKDAPLLAMNVLTVRLEETGCDSADARSMAAGLVSGELDAVILPRRRP